MSRPAKLWYMIVGASVLYMALVVYDNYEGRPCSLIERLNIFNVAHTVQKSGLYVISADDLSYPMYATYLEAGDSFIIPRKYKNAKPVRISK